MCHNVQISIMEQSQSSESHELEMWLTSWLICPKTPTSSLTLQRRKQRPERLSNLKSHSASSGRAYLGRMHCAHAVFLSHLCLVPIANPWVTVFWDMSFLSSKLHFRSISISHSPKFLSHCQFHEQKHALRCCLSITAQFTSSTDLFSIPNINYIWLTNCPATCHQK